VTIPVLSDLPHSDVSSLHGGDVGVLNRYIQLSSSRHHNTSSRYLWTMAIQLSVYMIDAGHFGAKAAVQLALTAILYSMTSVINSNKITA